MAKERRLPNLPVRREVNPMFFEMYRTRPPWDLGRAQPAFVELANEGMLRGSVLDLGCGTGDLVLELRERGHEVWGIDVVPAAIRQARAKARLRGLDDAVFLVGDALEVEHLHRRFGTVTDCGLFHTLSDPERLLYEKQVRKVLRPGGRLVLMVMSDWEDASWGGPRRVGQAEILDTFRTGWRVEDIREARFLVNPPFMIRGHAWLAILDRAGKGSRSSSPQKEAKAPRARARGTAGARSKSAAATAATGGAAPAPTRRPQVAEEV